MLSIKRKRDAINNIVDKLNVYTHYINYLI